MKTKLALASILALGVASAQGAIIASIDFETAGGYSTSITEFTDGSEDFFLRTDGSDVSSAMTGLTGVGGSYWFQGSDIDGEGATLPVSFEWSNIDITGQTGLGFNFDVAEDDDGTSNDWDDSDYVHVYYSIDGGSEQNLIWFENNGDEFNSAPFVDTDFDGTGDGTEVTDAFSNFSASIAGTGSSLDIRIEFSLNAGDEDFAMDNLQVTGVPEPSTFAAFAGLLALGFVVRRRMRK